MMDPSCEHEESVEMLALGMLDEAETALACAHLLLCESCREAFAMFEEERALFVRRAEAMPPPPFLAPPETTTLPERHARIVPLFVALAACAAFVFGLGRSFSPMQHVAMASSSSSSAQTFAASSFDEPLACSFPASGYVQLASYESLRCEGRATSEERVTSSLATP